MNVSLNWLGEMLGRRLDARETGGLLARAGAPVEGVEALHQDLTEVVVGLVEHVEKHPNADRLSLCRVNDGSGSPRQVVCGAPNVTAGRKYPFARVGTTLPGGLTLTARKIRSVESQGMLCSARELNLGLEHDGILELDTPAAPGTPLLAALPLADHRLTIEVTANRPDLLGHKGVAREIGAALGVPVRLVPIPGGAAQGFTTTRGRDRATADGVDVAIQDTDGCPRYLAAVIRGVTVGPSPEWLQRRLRAIGARPINNVVDATNYVLFEVNHPLHAFDLSRLEGPGVVVRRATTGERLVTLDGVDRTLSADMTAICDARRPVAVAGVMGGADGEVSPATRDILLECAGFDTRRVRATRQALKLSTEASYRFERGIDLQAAPQALQRAVDLLVAVAGGRVTGAVDVYPRPAPPPTVFLRPERVHRLLGEQVPVGEIERYLSSVGFTVAPKDERLAVQVPGWRPDVTQEVDLIEEVARLKGYDTFPTELRPFRPSNVPDDPVEGVKARARRVFAGLGLHETRSYSLGPAVGDAAVPVTNPLSAEDAFLRTDLLAGLVRATGHNWSARQRDIRLFEIGTVFHRQDGGDGRPRETTRMAAVVSGARTPPHWTASGKTPDFDLWDARGLFEQAVALVAPGRRVVEQGNGWSLESGGPGAAWGWAGELSADRPAWAARLFGFEVDVDPRAAPAATYRSLPVTPAVAQDLALVLPPGVTAVAVETLIRRAGGALLEAATIFDEYRAAAMRGRSVAWHLVFRAPDRTLRDEEVDRVVAAIVRAAREELGVERRES